jgi:hypothetical protein
MSRFTVALLALCAVCFVAALSTPGQAQICVCKGGGSSPSTTATAASCAEASSMILAAGDTWASNACATTGSSPCSETLVILTACHPVGSQWQETGTVRYHCEIC